MGKRGLGRELKKEMGGQWAKRMLAMVVITFLVISLFGLTFEKGPTKDIPTIIINNDNKAGNSSISNAIVSEMGAGTTLSLTSKASSDVDVISTSLQEVKDGKARAIIIFSQNFTSNILSWLAATHNGTPTLPVGVMLYVDASNPMVYGAIQAEVQRAIQSVMAIEFQVSSPVRIVPTIVYGAGSEMRDFMAPAIIGLLIFMLALLPCIMSTFGPGKKAGPEDQSTHGTRLLAQGTSSLVMGMLLAGTALLSLLPYGVMMDGDMSAAFVIFSLLALASYGLGQVLSLVTRRAPAAIAVILPLMIYPAILLGGIILPVSALPDYLLPISYLFPLTFAIDGSRMVLISGLGWESVWVQVSILVLYAVICLMLVWGVETWTIHRKKIMTKAKEM